MGLEIVTITDPATGSQARIAPGLGFNCFSFTPQASGAPLEVLWSEPTFVAGTTKPTRSGIPLLFPFAGRIRGTSFRFAGQQYGLEAGDGQGNAIHGFVCNRPWRVTAQTPGRVSGTFQASIDEPSVLRRWPADFRITVEYSITGNALTLALSVENPDSKPLPCGFGAHPYFRVPLGGPSADDCIVRVPVSQCWELEKLLPSGRHTATPETARLAAGMPVGQMQLDNVFGGLAFDHGSAVATLHDPGSGRTLSLEFGDEFTTCVVFNPPHREAVCVEPYTTLPDAFSLAEQGVDPHLRILAPGESLGARIEIRVD